MKLFFRALVLVCIALAPIVSSPARATCEQIGATPAQVKPPDCKKCKSTGRQPCPQHAKGENEHEDEVLFCSVFADCPVCGGTGWVPCEDCDNGPAREALAKKREQIATRKIALQSLDDTMKRPLRKAESAHFVLVWEMDRLKVERKFLGAHELLHLYLDRLEKLYADYCARMEITDKEFVEKFHVFVWQQLEDQRNGSLRFCKQGADGGVKLMGTNPSYSVCGNKQKFQNDEQLHRNIVHCVVHLLLSAEAPVAWIGNIKGGWLDEGLAHWFEDRYWNVCDTYCFQEQNANVDFKGGRFRLNMRQLVAGDKVPPIAEVLQQNVDTLTLPMHAACFSYVDYLMTRDGSKFVELGKKLKAKIPSRQALQEVYGMNPLDFEVQWKAWVLATYPTR